MKEEGETIVKCEWRGYDDKKTDYILEEIGSNRRNRDFKKRRKEKHTAR